MKYVIKVEGLLVMEGPLDAPRPMVFETLAEAEYWASMYTNGEICEYES